MFKNLFPGILCVFVISAVWSALPTSASKYHNVSVFIGNNRVTELYGSLEFTVTSGSTNIGDVEVNPGDRVFIYVSRLIDGGKMFIDSDGSVDMNFIANTTVYVNGRLVLENSSVRIKGIYIDLSTLNSTLTIHIYPQPSGQLRLVIDGTTVIDDQNDSSDVLIEGLRASSTQSLWIDNRYRHIEGLASVIKVNGAEIPIISTALLPVIALTALTAAFLVRFSSQTRALSKVGTPQRRREVDAE